MANVLVSAAAARSPPAACNRLLAGPRILDDLVVLGRAQQNTDGWAFVGLPDIAVERPEVELQLTEMLGLELVDLQFDGHQAVERPVEDPRETYAPRRRRPEARLGRGPSLPACSAISSLARAAIRFAPARPRLNSRLASR